MCNDKKYLLGHPLYRFMQRLEKWMDCYFVDPLLGLLLPGGWGDALSGLLALPAIYYSLWVVRSVPLTLAVTLNVLADVVLGLLPFMAGDVIDFFFRSYGRNMRLITGYVNGDKQVVAHVRRKAALSAVAIVVLARPVGLAVVAASPAVALPAAASPPFCQRAPRPAP